MCHCPNNTLLQGDQLASMSVAAIDYTDEASSCYLDCLNNQNMFADTAASMMLLFLGKRGKAVENNAINTAGYDKDRDKEHRKNYKRALMAFEAWLAMDPKIFALDIESEPQQLCVCVGCGSVGRIPFLSFLAIIRQLCCHRGVFAVHGGYRTRRGTQLHNFVSF